MPGPTPFALLLLVGCLASPAASRAEEFRRLLATFEEACFNTRSKDLELDEEGKPDFETTPFATGPCELGGVDRLE